MKNISKELFEFPKPRDSKGRFCSAERAYADKAITENKRLRYDKEKYFRAYLAAANKCSRLERELNNLKTKIKQLL